jgi:glycosyltransferase involved in cell wall biosynthesis
MFLNNKLTIVIPSYNEVNYIGKTLTSIYKQNGIKGIKVIVCDNNSKDGTQDEIIKYQKKFKDSLDIRLEKGGRVAQARNNGVKFVKTPYVLFIDADSILTNKNQILSSFRMMHKYDLDLLTCKIKSVSPSLKSKITFWIFNQINEIIKYRTPFAVGTFFMTKVSKFNELGGFDETVAHSEDFILSKKYEPKKFEISDFYVGQDDRRFKKMGYLGMIKLILKSYMNRNNIEYFRKDVGYW